MAAMFGFRLMMYTLRAPSPRLDMLLLQSSYGTQLKRNMKQLHQVQVMVCIFIFTRMHVRTCDLLSWTVDRAQWCMSSGMCGESGPYSQCQHRCSASLGRADHSRK